MGNSAKRQARKQEKERIKEENERIKLIESEYAIKSKERVLLLFGQSGSGKSELIDQILRIKYDINTKDVITKWNKTTFKLKSFTVNQYASNRTDSDIKYKYLEISMKRKLNFKEREDFEPHKTTNHLSIDKNIATQIIRSFVAEIIELIPAQIIELITNYISNPIITSYLLDNFASSRGCGKDYNGTFELWDIVGMNHKNIVHELYEYLNGIIFVVDISGYNEYIMEEGKKINKLSADLSLMGLVTQTIPENVDMILFLNKKDLFAEKLQSIPLTQWDAFKVFEIKYH